MLFWRHIFLQPSHVLYTASTLLAPFLDFFSSFCSAVKRVHFFHDLFFSAPVVVPRTCLLSTASARFLLFLLSSFVSGKCLLPAYWFRFLGGSPGSFFFPTPFFTEKRRISSSCFRFFSSLTDFSSSLHLSSRRRVYLLQPASSFFVALSISFSVKASSRRCVYFPHASSTFSAASPFILLHCICSHGELLTFRMLISFSPMP